MSDHSLYVVRGRRRSGSVTYRCPTPEWALRKLDDFEKTGLTDIAVTGPIGRVLGRDDLVRLVEGREASDGNRSELAEIATR